MEVRACGWSTARCDHGVLMCDGVQYSIGRAAMPVPGSDAQVRGGGGVAERLHASGCHLVAAEEVEGSESRQAAQCAQPLVRH